MTGLEDIERLTCLAISELTYSNIQSLSDMSSGFMLSNLLNLISSSHFPVGPEFDDWPRSIEKLSLYMRTNGVDRPFEISYAEVAKGDSRAILGPALQILTIIAALNPDTWTRALIKMPPSSAGTLRAVLDSIAAELREEAASSRRGGAHIEGGRDIKALLRRLEQLDERVRDLTSRNESLEKKLTDSQKESAALRATLAEKTREIEELLKARAAFLKALEERPPEICSEESADWRSRAEGLSSENKRLQGRCAALESALDEKSLELQRAKAAAERQQRVLAEAERASSEALDRFRRENSTLKADRELAEARVAVLEAEGKRKSRREHNRNSHEDDEGGDDVARLRERLEEAEARLELWERKKRLADEKESMCKEHCNSDTHHHRDPRCLPNLEDEVFPIHQSKTTPRPSHSTSQLLNANSQHSLEDEKNALIFSACASYAFEFFSEIQRYYTPDAVDRKRDIFKQFTLDNILKEFS